MEALSSLTSELKESLSGITNESIKENLIFKHIEAAEKLNYIVDDFPSDLDWFNTSQPLSSALLKGKIVVLDFFTYCCINCLHVIPYLRQLEENFSVADGLLVLGVHSAKFDNEKDSSNIFRALKRLNITHPVVNDKNCYLWNKLNVCCWPTILILSPQWQPIFAFVGEGDKEKLLYFIKLALKYYKESISSRSLPLNCDQIVTSSFFNFPGKIANWGNLFAVSDSGNHRILIFDQENCVKFQIGGKTPGFNDGKFQTALFNSPQGLVFYDANTIYVADTENHAVRLIDLSYHQVKTVVGTGRQGIDIEGGENGVTQEISSPWDVCIVPCSDLEDSKSLNNVAVSSNMSTTGPLSNSVPSNSPPLRNSSTFALNSPPPPPPFDSSLSTSSLPPPPSPFNSSSSAKIPSPPPPPPSFDSSLSSLFPPPPPPLPSCIGDIPTQFKPPLPPPLPYPSSGNLKPMPTSSKKQLKIASPSKVLLIAAAGTHQIWAYFIDKDVQWRRQKYKKNTCVAIAGSGKEENRNNSYPKRASFAQPSGLAYSPELKSVFIADSESSTLRKFNLLDGSVTHVIGGTKAPDDLFSYGDTDGKGYDVRLQHPLGVAWSRRERILYVCDTYNHKIKKVNVFDGTCHSIHQASDLFSEPGGCCLNESEEKLYVADTNNNCIKILNLSNLSVRKLGLSEQPKYTVDAPTKEIWETETYLSSSDGKLTLKVHFEPKKIHGKWKLSVDKTKVKVNETKGQLENGSFNLNFDFGPSEEDDQVEVFFDLVLCGSETCDFKKLNLTVWVRREEKANETAICEIHKNLS